ncbi:MAG TPA: cytochrome C oxidase subunit IV family protein [Longimicrobiales bacterium]
METTRKQPNYVMVWAGLAALTVVEVLVAFVAALPKEVLILILVGLAAWKALLVAMYYMHLRFEPLRLALMAASPLPLAAILVLAVLAEKF